MALIRLADAPIVAGSGGVLHRQYPGAKNGPSCDLSAGLGASLDRRQAGHCEMSEPSRQPCSSHP